MPRNECRRSVEAFFPLRPCEQGGGMGTGGGGMKIFTRHKRGTVIWSKGPRVLHPSATTAAE